MSDFVHLRLHSCYSLSEGAIKIDKLVSLCQNYNMPAVAVTDTNNMFGAMEFCLKCAQKGVQPILGCQLNVEHPKKIDKPTQLLLYAKNQDGYRNLIELISTAYLESSNPDAPEASLEMLNKYSDGLICATGGALGSLGYFLQHNDHDGAVQYLEFLKKIFTDRLYIELSRHNLPQENQIEEGLINFAYDFDLPLLATNNVFFPTKDYFDAHDVLICISQGKTIYDTERRASSAEYYFKSPEEMEKLFADIPEAISNTSLLAQRCSFMLKAKKPWMPIFKAESGKDQKEELRDMANSGLLARLEKFKNSEDYEEKKKIYFERLEYEISVIEQMGFSGYFLIVADYVRWAKSQNIPVGPGRGSGAGSIAAWAIEITDIDPIRFKLFFERFLNPDRVSMPDFDVDFCQERRDEVIRYVQRRYGAKSVAQIAALGKLQAKAVVKDVGRVLGLPYGFCDKISKMIPFQPTNPITLQEALDSEAALRQLVEENEEVRTLIQIALKLEGLYRHASVHAAGIVISDQIIQEHVPLYKDQKSSMPVTQFSMKYIENAGLIKFDFLGLKTLTVIQKILDIIREKRGIDIKSHNIPFEDKKTFELLQRIDCVGIFQIESAGMRDVLQKLQPDKIEDLIALVALYRPGPMDDIPKYIACKHGVEPITYLHEKLIPILEETYGVMVYQEQVMQIAQVMAGYTLGQADILRRAMGKKNKDEMQAQQARFIDGAVARGVDKEVAERLFELMSKFASYGFNKSHSTPYGVLTYQTAYLKANYLIEFYSAVMLLDITNTDKLYIYVQDARKNGVKIIPPDINESGFEFLIDYEDNAIKYSLAAIKGSSDAVIQEIESERAKNGPYKSIFDFTRRTAYIKNFNRRQFQRLIKAGAFDSLHPNRHELIENFETILTVVSSDSLDQGMLFGDIDPDLKRTPCWGCTEKLQEEFEAVGFYLSEHPVEQYREKLNALSAVTFLEAQKYFKVTVVVVITLVTYKLSKNKTRFCSIQVSDETLMEEVSVFSETLERCSDAIREGNIVLAELAFYKNEGQTRIIADSIRSYNGGDFEVIKRTQGDKRTFKKKFDEPKEVSEPRGTKILSLKIETSEELLAVRRLIDNLRRAPGGFIELYIVPEDTKIRLKDSYYLSQFDILDFRNAIGIDKVTESYQS